MAHAYAAIELVALAIAVSLSLLNKLTNMHKKTKARPNKKTTESAEISLCNKVPAISSQVVSRKSRRLSRHSASNIVGRTGHHN